MLTKIIFENATQKHEISYQNEKGISFKTCIKNVISIIKDDIPVLKEKYGPKTKITFILYSQRKGKLLPQYKVYNDVDGKIKVEVL